MTDSSASTRGAGSDHAAGRRLLGLLAEPRRAGTPAREPARPGRHDHRCRIRRARGLHRRRRREARGSLAGDRHHRPRHARRGADGPASRKAKEHNKAAGRARRRVERILRVRLGTLARGGVLDRRPARPWALPRAFLPRSRTPVPGGAWVRLGSSSTASSSPPGAPWPTSRRGRERCRGGYAGRPAPSAGWSSQNTSARTSMLSRGGVPGGVSGSSKAPWAESRARPSVALS